ncbi:SAM-dependent methyltransferase [Lipingzhangella sp. LS1_29]|uniref:SAM-dependent methyltransferase n=1 Tax=Lipingzhangella rawalii TaxID=2055835 RepID=A0ABU2H979_9ACTN|nr:SAM-dependent methyltransferase [Lipingzhangella rawalii]MDS1271846.1 SAM-dependent methyltransferase [Lipingzhangella rawalii]
MSDTDQPFPPDLPTDYPTPARVYGYGLGSKDNFAVDRAATVQGLTVFPELLDIARQNRLFLYRAVRYLARDVGIRQFLDLGSGLPTNNNVHQVAQQFAPDSTVVYVDNDPIVLTHGRALLADNPNTTVISADMTEPDTVLDHPDTRSLIDVSQPVAVLMFSIPHCIPEDAAARRAVHGPMERVAPGSYLAFSHVCANDEATAAESTQVATSIGMTWRTRTAAEVTTWLEGLEPVAPGLGDITDWRPDPDQPPLEEVAAELAPFLGASARSKRVYEFGGVLHLDGQGSRPGGG